MTQIFFFRTGNDIPRHLILSQKTCSQRGDYFRRLQSPLSQHSLSMYSLLTSSLILLNTQYSSEHISLVVFLFFLSLPLVHTLNLILNFQDHIVTCYLSANMKGVYRLVHVLLLSLEHI